jgi:hypothetical protein
MFDGVAHSVVARTHAAIEKAGVPVLGDWDNNFAVMTLLVE